MIVRKGLDLPRLLRVLGPTLAVLLAYDVIVTVLVIGFGYKGLTVPDLPIPVLGSVIALIVSMRNNRAYDRWWEARTLWGGVVNNARSFTRGLMVFVDDVALRDNLVRHQIAYVLALRCHLLRKPSDTAISRYLPPQVTAGVRVAANVPAAIQFAIAHRLSAARASGTLDPIGAATLDRTLSDLTNAQGGLERIKNTPLARQFSQLPRVFTRLFCVLLPLGLVQDLGLATPVGSTIIGFMLLALDRVGNELEDPFEDTMHDVAMTAITRGIEIDLLQAIDSSDVPAPEAPRAGILW